MSTTAAPADGRFVRLDSRFRDIVDQRPEPGRFHLYVSKACPWAHRTIIVRGLKGLQTLVPMTVLDPIRDERGWRFFPDQPDPVNSFTYLAEAYEQTEPGYDGRVSVPVLYDIAAGRILNNESEEVIRMFDAWGDEGPNLFPDALREEILALNDRVYVNVNDGVYKTGFARSQAAYEEAFDDLFTMLDELDARLSEQRYLVGNTLTEADVRLFTTLVRFDAVYHGHFKCNLRRIVDYPHLSAYLRDLYQHPGFGETVDIDQIKRHYYVTHRSINGNGIVPKGPLLDFEMPHGRDALGPRTL